MPRGDAVQAQPTLEDQMAAFRGFSTKDGEVSDGTPTKEEADRATREAAAAKTAKAGAAANEAGRKPAAKGAAEEEGEEEVEITENETPEQKAAREAATTKSAKQRSAQTRIDKAVARLRTAERTLAAERENNAKTLGALQARLDALEKGPLTKDGDKGKGEKADPNAPNPADFDYGELDTKYIRALARYEAGVEYEARNKTQQDKTQSDAQEKAKADFEKAKATLEKAGAAKYDDFDEVVVQALDLPKDDPDFWPLSPTMGELILTSPEVGHDVAYYLATHIDEAKELFGKSPAKQAAWFGRKEAEFSSESSDAAEQDPPADGQQRTKVAATLKTTKAPPPLQTKVKGAGGKPQQSADTTDFKAFEAMAMQTQK